MNQAEAGTVLARIRVFISEQADIVHGFNFAGEAALLGLALNAQQANELLFDALRQRISELEALDPAHPDAPSVSVVDTEGPSQDAL